MYIGVSLSGYPKVREKGEGEFQVGTETFLQHYLNFIWTRLYSFQGPNRDACNSEDPDQNHELFEPFHL